MVPTERIRFPLRWEFTPVPREQDGSIHWRWRAYGQGGALGMESERLFDTLSECIEDAKARGYDPSHG